MMDIAYDYTLIARTPNAYKALSFKLCIGQTSYNILTFNKSTLIEIEPNIWCLTDFGYNHRYFKQLEDYKKSIKCLIEVEPTAEQRSIIERLLNSGNLELSLDLTLSSLNLIEQKSSYSGHHINQCDIHFQFTLEAEQYTIAHFQDTFIYLAEDEVAYEKQLLKWEEGLKEMGASQIQNLSTPWENYTPRTVETEEELISIIEGKTI